MLYATQFDLHIISLIKNASQRNQSNNNELQIIYLMVLRNVTIT